MYGQLLFSLQVITMVFCVFPLSLLWPKPLVLLLLVLSTLIMVWVLVVNKLGNWSVFPEPLNHAKLVTSGPYGLVRHPMYSVVMLVCFSALIHNQTLTALGSWLLLLVILRVKAGYEEKLLRSRFEDYEGYISRTRKRFIPGLF